MFQKDECSWLLFTKHGGVSMGCGKKRKKKKIATHKRKKRLRRDRHKKRLR